jgi:hypothetical protein
VNSHLELEEPCVTSGNQCKYPVDYSLLKISHDGLARVKALTKRAFPALFVL